MKNVFIAIAILFSPSVYAEDWITEEVLKQLSEVRKELKVLQDEIKDLKESMANQPAVVNAPTNSGVVDVSNTPYIGDANADIAIIEFSDYQCPYCKRHFNQTMPDIKKNFIDSGKVKYVMKQFPLDFHAQARGASIAALCIERFKQGEYWRAHEGIFSGETGFNRADYLELAAELKIDQGEYESCLDDPIMSQQVDADMQEGTAVGVSGTPAFYVGKIVDGKVTNGQLITGARPYSSFSGVVNALVDGG